MSSLPSGWIETGLTFDFSGAVTAQVAAYYGSGGASEPLRVEAGSDDIFIGVEPSGGFIVCGQWGSADTVSLYARKDSEAFGARSVVDTVAGGCPQPYLAVEVTRVVTGARLAANVDVESGGGPTQARYRLWLDELSTDTVTVGPKSTVVAHTGELVEATAILVTVRAAGGPAVEPLENGIVFAGAAWNDEADPTQFDAFPVFPGTGDVITYATLPPLHYTLDVDVRDAGGGTPAGLIAIRDLLIANQSIQAVTEWRWTLSAGMIPVTAALSGDWSAGGVEPPSEDLSVPLRQLKPKTPGDAPEFWTPTTYEIVSPVSVLLSANTFSGAGSVVVSGTGNQTWTVSGAGASVTRTLLEKWRDWNDPIDPDFEADDGFRTTKHDFYASGSASDVWGWGLFAWLDVDLTAPGAGDLTMTITWVAAGDTPVTAEKTYTIPVAGAGRVVYRIDLLFPNEGGPWYAERVDEIAFEGFVNGVYELHDLELVAVLDAYVKVHARGTYSGLVISQDGQFCTGQWGDNPFISGFGNVREKDDESGLFSFDGAPSDTSIGGAVRMDGTLEDTANEWDRMEGIEITYNDVAIDADLTDGVNVIGTVDGLIATPLVYSARWYHTLMAERAAKNTAKTLPTSIWMDGGADICTAPAGTFVLPFRHTLGMVLEAQCEEAVGGARAGANAPVYARRSLSGAPTSSDTLMAQGVTDASGFASVAIRNGTVEGQEINVALLGS